MVIKFDATSDLTHREIVKLHSRLVVRKFSFTLRIVNDWIGAALMSKDINQFKDHLEQHLMFEESNGGLYESTFDFLRRHLLASIHCVEEEYQGRSHVNACGVKLPIGGYAYLRNTRKSKPKIISK